MAMAALQGLPRRVARRRGSPRRGGASGRIGEARGWRWLRQRWPVATAALGRERESEGEERMGTGESERGAGRRVASFGRSRRRGEKQEVARMRAGGERVPLSSWREEGDDWQCQSAGPACWAAQCPAAQGGKCWWVFFLSIYFCFL